VSGIPTSVNELEELAPEELREMCRVLWAILEFCERAGALRPRESGFDRDELGIDPEEDYEEEY